MIVVALGGNCQGKRTADGLYQERLKGSICIIPAGQTFQARLEGESEHLAMYVDPSLLLNAAPDAHGSTAIEVVESCRENDPVISNVAFALLAELKAAETGAGPVSGRLYTESLGNVLAVHLLRHYTALGARDHDSAVV